MRPGAVARYLSRCGPVAPLEGRSPGGCGAAVVIPALAESADLFATLADLAACDAAARERTLVVVVVNHRADHPEAMRADSRATLARLRAGAGPEGLRLAWVDAASPGRELGPKAGVGHARRLGLDAALAALDPAARHGGALICLDADTRVGPDYLGVVRRHFAGEDAWAATIRYAHRLEGAAEQQAAICAYEAYLRYHEHMLARIGSPYAFQAIGSTMACTGAAYAAVAGMPKRAAAEDFYFLNKLAKAGPVARIEETLVRPANRVSPRVPFGTGRSITAALAGRPHERTVVQPASYRIVGAWLAEVAADPLAPAEAHLDRAEAVAAGLRAALETLHFARDWPGIVANARGRGGALTQFHRWFDGLKTLRALHLLRDAGLPDVSLYAALAEAFGPDAVPEGAARGDAGALAELLHSLRRRAVPPYPRSIREAASWRASGTS